MNRRIGIVFVLTALLPVRASAEPCRARFLARDHPELLGELLVLTEHIAVVQVAETAQVDTLELVELYVLEISRREVNAGMAAGTTLAASILGGIVGYLLGESTCPESQGNDPEYDICDKVFIGTFLGMAIGTSMGLLIGLQPDEIWTVAYASPEAQRDRRLRGPWNERPAHSRVLMK